MKSFVGVHEGLGVNRICLRSVETGQPAVLVDLLGEVLGHFVGGVVGTEVTVGAVSVKDTKQIAGVIAQKGLTDYVTVLVGFSRIGRIETTLGDINKLQVHGEGLSLDANDFRLFDVIQPDHWGLVVYGLYIERRFEFIASRGRIGCSGAFT